VSLQKDLYKLYGFKPCYQLTKSSENSCSAGSFAAASKAALCVGKQKHLALETSPYSFLAFSRNAGGVYPFRLLPSKLIIRILQMFIAYRRKWQKESCS
jgi:hypothetical protein